jgi:thiamine-monophosphate kinase
MSAFTDEFAASLAALGEKALIVRMREWLNGVAPQAPTGMGDDCAVFENASTGYGLLTTDSVVCGRHFLESDPPHLVGQKLVNRNLSDIAAMGGHPDRAIIAAFLPGTLRTDWLEACYAGIRAAAMASGLSIVGGDVTESNDLALNLSLMGTAIRPLLRTGGRPGDHICVTGSLGGTRLGKHLSFQPRLKEGQILAANPAVRACMDISDGLSIDLPEMLGQECSASIDTAAIPIAEDAFTASKSSGQSPLWHALNDGEDHELLFILDPRPPAYPLPPHTVIGTLTERQAQLIVDAHTGEPLPTHTGYEHFR